MLTNKHIAVIGGDERYFEVIDFFAHHHAKVDIVGYKEIEFYNGCITHKQIDDIDFSALDAILLPVQGTNEKGDIKVNYPNATVTLTKEHMQNTATHCSLFTGTTNAFLNDLANKNERDLIVLFERDDIAIANSIPTAEAALQIAMDQIDYTIHGANVLVTGFGRVGFTTARLFHQIGANVTVSVRSDKDVARLNEMRLEAIHHDNLVETGDIDIFINTVPHLLFTKNVIDQMNKTALIIDLASKPGGTDFVAAKNANITAIHALALPGKYAPKTAGSIIANVMKDMIK